MYVLFQPANALDLPYIEFRDVWFDIQEGSPVYDINILNMENPGLYPEETNYRKSYRVWPGWPPDCKNPMLTVIHERLNPQGCPLGQMKVVKQDNVRKSVDILEAFYIFRKHLHSSSDASGACRLYWGSLGLFERRANNPDRPIPDLIHSSIRPLGLLLHQLLATTGESAGISGGMTPALFSRCAHIPAFFYYLELKPTLLTNINLSLFHFMTIRHFTNLLSAAQTILTHIIKWVSRARKSREIISPSGQRRC
jgi:hypothetical protein